MKKNVFLKFITMILLFSMFFILVGTGEVKAVLQSNGNNGVKYNLTNWIKNVRKMEELGGAMGLTESINTNLTTNGESNNIDVHMQKNTEYGALAILSASSYGNPNKIEDGDTTTGNVTGVVMKLNSEWVAVKGPYLSALNFVTKRYKNDYLTAKGRVGDALFETNGWHSSVNSDWYINADGGMLRANSGGIFSHYTHGGLNANAGAVHYSRAVVVSGQGF